MSLRLSKLNLFFLLTIVINGCAILDRDEAPIEETLISTGCLKVAPNDGMCANVERGPGGTRQETLKRVDAFGTALDDCQARLAEWRTEWERTCLAQ